MNAKLAQMLQLISSVFHMHGHHSLVAFPASLAMPSCLGMALALWVWLVYRTRLPLVQHLSLTILRVHLTDQNITHTTFWPLLLHFIATIPISHPTTKFLSKIRVNLAIN